MAETLEPVANEVDQQQLAQELLAQAREQGVDLVGPNGLLNQLTKQVLETALEAEMTEHLGYDKHDAAGRGSGNSRNGTRSKTVITEIGPVEIVVPRDTASSFDPADRAQAATPADRGGRDRAVGFDATVGEGPDHRGDRRALRRRLRCDDLEGHDLEDHRQGPRGDG
jgi:hypothetical protein